MYNHRWSGWPGAYCLKCGQEDKMEYAISTCLFDPYTETWKEGIDPEDYSNGECSVSNEEYEKRYSEWRRQRRLKQGPEKVSTGCQGRQ